jgi:predicted DCC family thiol-disulfide oxidoreductase YuxK
MNTIYPLTVYFDASCRLCNSEMQNIKLHDHDNQLLLIDCSQAEFDDTPFRAEGITQEKMMNRLHAQDAEGNWLVGVDAFEVIYRKVGLLAIAELWGGRFIKPLAVKLYPWIVMHRYTLSKMGFAEVFGLWSKREAKKAEQRSAACREQRCSINE